jgi:YVTN family beta-propeller protein
VSVISTATKNAYGTVPVGTGPRAIAITPDGATAYVANELSGTVTPIDIATSTALTPILAQKLPWAIAIVPPVITSETLHGGYTAAGIGMRDLGYGTINITGVPAGATVKSAVLLWDILSDQVTPRMAQGTFNRTPVTGTLSASGGNPCWDGYGISGNYAYEADVTGLVTGNGSYKLTGFASSVTDGTDPWSIFEPPPLLEGASLVVIYQSLSMPQAVIQVTETATETDPLQNPATTTLTGFKVGVNPDAIVTYIVADGQMTGNTAQFNGTTLPGIGFPGADPQAVPDYSQGISGTPSPPTSARWSTKATPALSSASPATPTASWATVSSSSARHWQSPTHARHTPD